MHPSHQALAATPSRDLAPTAVDREIPTPGLASAPGVARARRRWLRRLAALVLIGATWAAYAYWFPGAVLLARLIDSSPQAQHAGSEVREYAVEVPDLGPVRVYLPTRGTRRVSVLVHGVHRAGPDEPRLIAAARKLAGMGLTVVTPRIEELTRYDIERPALDRVRAAARWTLDHSGLVPTGRRIGLMGICFGGGLAVACAGDPELSDRIAYTFSLGGHARLDEVLAYLASGQGPDLLPDVYGQAVVLRQLAPLGLPPAQVGPLREALRQFLDGDETASRAAADALPEPARSLMGRVLDRDARALAATLAEWVPRYRPDPSLSPLLCPPPRGPVFLLHAAGDRVIPPGQSEALARHLASQVSVRVLVTGMFAHVDPGPGSIPEALELAAFLTDLLGQ